MSALLALDPGGCTGWSLWLYGDQSPLEHVDHGQIPGGVDGFVSWWRQSGISWDEVVSESFVLDGRTPNPDITPLRIEGALAVLWRQGVHYQRNTAKMHLTNDQAKEFGVYWPGQQHAIDSARHAFARMKAIRHMPSLLRYWPPRKAAA